MKMNEYFPVEYIRRVKFLTEHPVLDLDNDDYIRIVICDGDAIIFDLNNDVHYYKDRINEYTPYIVSCFKNFGRYIDESKNFDDYITCLYLGIDDKTHEIDAFAGWEMGIDQFSNVVYTGDDELVKGFVNEDLTYHKREEEMSSFVATLLQQKHWLDWDDLKQIHQEYEVPIDNDIINYDPVLDTVDFFEDDE